MDGQEVIGLLSTLASVAASLVGFSGLLTALRASSEDLSPNDVTNVRILLMFGVAALLFALFPLIGFAFHAGATWLAAATVLLGVFLIVWIVQSPRWMRAKGLKPRSPRVYWTTLIGQAVIGLVLVVGIVLGRPAAPLYLAGVCALLVTAIVAFVVQVFAMLPVDRAGRD